MMKIPKLGEEPYFSKNQFLKNILLMID